MIFFEIKNTAVQNEFAAILSNPRFTNLSKFALGANPLAELKEVIRLKAINISQSPDFSKKNPVAKLALVFGQLWTEIGALSGQQLVGSGKLLKKPIDNETTVRIRTYANALTQIFPVIFKVVNGEGARDDSYTLQPGEIIKKFDLDPNKPINYENHPEFIELLELLDIDVEAFKAKYIYPIRFDTTIDGVDGTTFDALGGHRATSVVCNTHVPHDKWAVAKDKVIGQFKEAIDLKKFFNDTDRDYLVMKEDFKNLVDKSSFSSETKNLLIEIWKTHRDGFLSLLDEEYSFNIAVARGLVGVDTAYPRVGLKEIVRQTAIAKVLRDQKIDLNKIENEIERENKISEAINQLNIGIMNRPQNMYLLRELKEAGVHLPEENGKFVYKKGRTKGKDYNLMYTDRVQAVGDGNVPSFAGELDLFIGTGGATEMAILAATCESGTFYPLERDKVAELVKAMKNDPTKADAVKILISKMQQINGDPNSPLVKEVYSAEYIEKARKNNWTDEEIFKGGLSVKDIIRYDIDQTATFITAITSMTGSHTMASPEIADRNHEKFIGAEGMEGTQVGDHGHVQISTAVFAGKEQFMVTRKYETIVKEYQKEIEALVGAITATLDNGTSNRSNDERVLALEIKDLYTNYYEYLSFVARIGIIDLYTEEFNKFASLTESIVNRVNVHKRIADMVRWKDHYIQLIQYIKTNWREKETTQKQEFYQDIITRAEILQAEYHNNVEIYKHIDDVAIVAIDEIIRDAKSELVP